MGPEFQVCKMERVLEKDGSVGCTTTLMYSRPLNCAFLNGEDGKFYVI